MYEKKLELLIEVSRQIREVRTALDVTLKEGKLRPLRSGVPYDVSIEGDVTWKEDPEAYRKKDKGYLFSTAYDYLENQSLDLGVLLRQMDVDSVLNYPQQQEALDPDYEAKLKKIGIDPSTLPPTKRKFHLVGDMRMLQDDFHFSGDSRKFGAELHNVILLFAYTKGEDQAVEYLAMRALFHAGQILERLKSVGVNKSDEQSRRSKTWLKNGPDKESFIKTYRKHKGEPKWAEAMKCVFEKLYGENAPAVSTIYDRVKKLKKAGEL